MVLVSVLPLLLAAAQPRTERVVVDAGRPVAEAALEIAKRCLCVITYEDQAWDRSEVVPSPDAATSVPASVRFEFELPLDLAGQRARTRDAIRAMLQAFNGLGGARRFKLLESATAFSIVPVTGSPLDVTISFTSTDGTLADTLRRFLDVVSRQSHTRLLEGNVPSNFVMQHSVIVVADRQTARDVLDLIWSAAGARVSWRLLYDYGMQAYFLNVTLVSVKP